MTQYTCDLITYRLRPHWEPEIALCRRMTGQWTPGNFCLYLPRIGVTSTCHSSPQAYITSTFSTEPPLLSFNLNIFLDCILSFLSLQHFKSYKSPQGSIALWYKLFFGRALWSSVQMTFPLRGDHWFPYVKHSDFSFCHFF